MDVSCLESVIPGMSLIFELKLTAPATTGPAKQPRPTSSTPITVESSDQNSFSNFKLGNTLAILAFYYFLRVNSLKPWKASNTSNGTANTTVFDWSEEISLI